MNSKELMENGNFLRGDLLTLLKMGICVSTIVFTTCFLIPRGIAYYKKWKETQKMKNLTFAVNYISYGTFMLLYLLAMAIIDSLLAYR